MPAPTEIIHGTTIAMGGRAVVLRGVSGCGKSDLALRCLGVGQSFLGAGPVELVSDDQTVVRLVNGHLMVSAPRPLKGLLEVRGVGIFKRAYIPEARLVLIADLVERSEIERLPEPLEPQVILGVGVRRIELAAFEFSAHLKVLLALSGEVADR